MLLNKKQTDTLENLIWSRFSKGMSARPDIELKNMKTGYGAVISISITVDVDTLERSNSQIVFGTTFFQNCLFQVGANQYNSISVSVGLSAHYAFVTVFAHAHQ